jgi:ABC-2 type transport system permease protein
MFPIDQMPYAVQLFTLIVPARYFMSILRKMFLKGSELTFLWNELMALTIFAALLVVVATRAFRKNLG